MVEHDSILRQQKDTKGIKNRDKERNAKKKNMMMKPEQDTATKADIGLETTDFGDR
jgi:hypothetical protein